MTRYFASRADAAMRLAAALDAFRGRSPLVLAIPRGGVEIGARIAEALQGELDVVLVRKLRAPHSPEYAIGSVDESGWLYLSPQAGAAGADDAYIEREKQRQLAALRRRRTLYTPARPPIDPKGRIAIVVDDGLATGASMIAALHAVRARLPSRLVCAVPVAPPETVQRMRAHADEVVCLEAPANFMAVGQFYGNFEQVQDDIVVALLKKRRTPPSGRVAAP